jgi:AcrR family transcriptional regulator
VPDPVKTRPYRSRKRREAAEATRHAVLQAARALFTRHGYVDTAVADVAARAGVSVDTVYASVGRKPQLLLAVHDMELGSSDLPIPAEQRDYVRAFREAVGARAKISLYAEAMGRLLPRTVPLSDALRVAAATDADCRKVWRELDDRRSRNMRLLAADLRSTGEVRNDLTDDDVAELIWSMNSPQYYLLVTQHGRSPEEYAALVADVWTRTLLAARP